MGRNFASARASIHYVNYRTRVLPRLLTIGLALALAASAGAKPAPTPQAIEFAIWHAPDANLGPLGGIVRAAQAACPGLVVNLRHYPPEDAYRRLQEWATRDGSAWPDVVVVRDLWLPQFAAHLQPANALVRASDLRAFPDSVRARLKLGGTLYGVPWATESRVLFYRPDILAAAGVLPPQTWAQVLAAARRCHRPPEVYGFGMPGVTGNGTAELLLQMLWAHGTDLPPSNAPSLLPVEALERSLDLLDQLHPVCQPEVLSWTPDMLRDFFLRGRLAMLIAPAGFGGDLATAAAASSQSPETPPLAWDALPLPSGDRAAGFISVDMACVSRRTAHLAACGALLRALSSPAGVAALTAMGTGPLTTGAGAPEGRGAVWEAARADLAAARGLPSAGWDAAAAALSEGAFGLLTGRQTVEEACVSTRMRLERGETLGGGLTPARRD